MKTPKIKLEKSVVSDSMDSMLDITSEVTHLAKRGSYLKIEARVVYPNGHIQPYKALINEDENFCLVPILNKAWMVEKVHTYENTRVVYLPYKYHKSLDLNKLIKPITYALTLGFQHLRKWKTIQLSNLTTTIDLNQMDNDLSPDFIVDSHKVLKTKSLEFLQEVPKKTIIFAIIISTLVGIILGGITTTIAMFFIMN